IGGPALAAGRDRGRCTRARCPSELEQVRIAHAREREQAFGELDRLASDIGREREAREAADRKLAEMTQQKQIAEQASAEVRGELNAIRRTLEQRERELEAARTDAIRINGALEAERALRHAAEIRDANVGAQDAIG